jgi:hypothetical protein
MPELHTADVGKLPRPTSVSTRVCMPCLVSRERGQFLRDASACRVLFPERGDSFRGMLLDTRLHAVSCFQREGTVSEGCFSTRVLFPERGDSFWGMLLDTRLHAVSCFQREGTVSEGCSSWWNWRWLSPQMINQECEVRRPWWPNALWNYSVAVASWRSTSCVCSNALLLQVVGGYGGRLSTFMILCVSLIPCG